MSVWCSARICFCSFAITHMRHVHFVYSEEMIYSDCNLLLMNKSYDYVYVYMLFCPFSSGVYGA